LGGVVKKALLNREELRNLLEHGHTINASPELLEAFRKVELLPSM
jgi:hypothetical protein